ncbi:hypothetical protein Tco_1226425 [Tanacetum coccineum]|uniref:Uncharacterized protein n=1 Tax=Tanacetum coccineum TaxID=301880 RepID=A0ABQ5GX35_9ASTR
MPTPSPLPPISLSPPSARERLARYTAPPALSSPPPVPSPLLPSSGCPTQIQTLRMASTQALVDAVTAALQSPPLPPSLYIPPPIDRRDDIPESEQPPRKRLCLSTLGSRYEVGKSSTARPTGGRGIDYRFVSTVDAEARRQEISEVGYGLNMDTWDWIWQVIAGDFLRYSDLRLYEERVSRLGGAELADAPVAVDTHMTCFLEWNDVGLRGYGACDEDEDSEGRVKEEEGHVNIRAVHTGVR